MKKTELHVVDTILDKNLSITVLCHPKQVSICCAHPEQVNTAVKSASCVSSLFMQVFACSFSYSFQKVNALILFDK